MVKNGKPAPDLFLFAAAAMDTDPQKLNVWRPTAQRAGVLRRELGDGWLVVEEGLPGRTAVNDDPVEGLERNGRTHRAAAPSRSPRCWSRRSKRRTSPASSRCAAAYAFGIGGIEALADLTRHSADPALMSRLKLQVNTTLLEVLALLREQPVRLDTYLSSSRRTVAMFLEGLAAHLDTPWTLDSLAEACGLGRTQFANYCIEITNVSPMDYLNALRIKRARELLRAEPDRSITDIAALCGFDTSQYFATRFRREVGQTPREFRAVKRPRPPRADAGKDAAQAR